MSESCQKPKFLFCGMCYEQPCLDVSSAPEISDFDVVDEYGMARPDGKICVQDIAAKYYSVYEKNGEGIMQLINGISCNEDIEDAKRVLQLMRAVTDGAKANLVNLHNKLSSYAEKAGMENLSRVNDLIFRSQSELPDLWFNSQSGVVARMTRRGRGGIGVYTKFIDINGNKTEDKSGAIYLEIIAVTKGSVAKKAGIKVGDKIRLIDNIPVADTDLLGRCGSVITISGFSPDGTAFTKSVERELTHHGADLSKNAARYDLMGYEDVTSSFGAIFLPFVRFFDTDVMVLGKGLVYVCDDL